MNAWLFPTTLFLFALTLWVLCLLFIKKQAMGMIAIASGLVAAVSILLLLHRGYSAFASILICIVFLIVIIYFGFDISFSKSDYSGPLANFIGKKGIAITYLDPKGRVEIDGQEVPAITEGLMIPKGSEIRVIRCSNTILIVERSDQTVE